MSNRFITIAMISLALAACGKKNSAPVAGGTPGDLNKPNPGTSVPKDKPIPPATVAIKTVLEGVWETPVVDGFQKKFTVTGNEMIYEEIDSKNESNYFRQDLKIVITKNPELGYWTYQVDYSDEAGQEHTPEIFHLDENPASVVIGQARRQAQTYFKK